MILVERAGPMGNVGFEEGARCASFSQVGMGQGKLSFSKELPRPVFKLLTGGQKMNIKSLLIGSAAALVAVSGARAADAVVVAEPEPAEYVRICDVYGAGFYYIPGTETCLKVGGYVRVQIGAGGGDLNGGFGLGGHQDVTDRSERLDGVAFPLYNNNDTYSWLTRGNIHFDARTETEYGTLRSYIELSFNNQTRQADVLDWALSDGAIAPGQAITENGWALEHALIQLGGLTIGYTDSLFETLTGSAGALVINDSIVGYTPGKAHYVAYTFDAGNGFSATLGLEAGAGANYIDSYVPHVVVGASYTQGWGSISGVVGYDSNFGEWAGKLRADVTINDQLSVWVMGGLASDDDASGLANHYNTWNGDWAVWGGFDYRFSEKGTLYAQLSYTDGFDSAAYTADIWGAAVGVNYELVPGLLIRPEFAYASAKAHPAAGGTDRENAWGFNVRFQRSF